MQIPGLHQIINKDTIPESIFILNGNPGVGKSVYCRNFYLDGLLNGDYCIYIDCLLGIKNFKKLFSEIEEEILNQNSLFINPYKLEVEVSNKLNVVLHQVQRLLNPIKINFTKINSNQLE